MSWQGYVDEQLMESPHLNGQRLSAAAILGLDGGIWAASESFPQLGESDIKTMGGVLSATAPPTSFKMGETKYISIASAPGILRGKMGETGICAKKTNLAIVVALYGKGCNPGTANNVVETLGEYLIAQNL